jgi:hypothetical protein
MSKPSQEEHSRERMQTSRARVTVQPGRREFCVIAHSTDYMGLLEDSGTGWLFLTQRPVKLT